MTCAPRSPMKGYPAPPGRFMVASAAAHSAAGARAPFDISWTRRLQARVAEIVRTDRGKAKAPSLVPSRRKRPLARRAGGRILCAMSWEPRAFAEFGSLSRLDGHVIATKSHQESAA